MLSGECLMMMRGPFDRVIIERLSDHTHFTDEETEALRGSVTCPNLHSASKWSSFRSQACLSVVASSPWL